MSRRGVEGMLASDAEFARSVHLAELAAFDHIRSLLFEAAKHNWQAGAVLLEVERPEKWGRVQMAPMPLPMGKDLARLAVRYRELAAISGALPSMER